MKTVKINKNYNDAMDALWNFLGNVNRETVNTASLINANITARTIRGADICSTEHLNKLFDEYHQLRDAVEDSKFEASFEVSSDIEETEENLTKLINSFRDDMKAAEYNITAADFIISKKYDIPGNIHNGMIINGGKDTIVVQLYNDQAYVRRLASLVKEGLEFLLSELYELRRQAK